MSTQYWEADHAPCNESPLGAAFAIQWMLLQSWSTPGDALDAPTKIRVFPAVPDKWANASFGSMVAEGGWLVSAVRTQRLTAWLSITAPASGGASHVLLWSSITDPVADSARLQPSPLGTGWWLLGPLAPNASARVFPRGRDPGPAVTAEPVAWLEDEEWGQQENWWGLHPRTTPPPPPPHDGCGSGAVPGYSCHAESCARDGPPPSQGCCGWDICQPSASAPDNRTGALCGPLSCSGGASAACVKEAARRCNASSSCVSFALSPRYREGAFAKYFVATAGGRATPTACSSWRLYQPN